MSTAWGEGDIGSQQGRRVVITGANSGIGWEAARMMFKAGAEVVLACRDAGKAEAARRAIADDPRLIVMALDLADLSSVRAFAQQLGQRFTDGIDFLCNNAGVMAIPRRETRDGFEMQFGTNHLGHFALTGLLLHQLRPGGRVVNVSSMAHTMGRMNFADLHHTQRYEKWSVYGMSKLANLLFTLGLEQRLRAAGRPITALSCHPGYAATNLQSVGPLMEGSSLMLGVMSFANRTLAQSAAMGALPTVYAMVAPEAPGGAFVGPRWGGVWGPPVLSRSNAASYRVEDADQLWVISEQLTGVSPTF